MSHLKLILHWKRGKIRNSDPNHSSGTLTQKSIQCFRQQINDPISIQPKYCTDMEKNLGQWIKESQTHHLTRASPYNLRRMWKILQTDSSHAHRCNRAALMRFSMMTKQKHLVSWYVTIFTVFFDQIKKVRKYIMNYIHIYSYHWSRIFILFNINSVILRKLGKYVVSFFNCLQLKAKCSFFTVRVFIDKNIFGTYKLVFI